MIEIAATTIIVAPLAFVAGAWWASRDSIVPADVDDLGDAYYTAVTSHTRATDALNTSRARIDRALACETPKAAHGVRKMAAILRGEA